MEESAVLAYVIYDRSSGRILATTAFHFVDRDVEEPTPAEILESVGELPGGAEDAEILRLEKDVPLGGAVCVDIRSKTLVPMLHLEVHPERTELEGDGKDTTPIEIRLVDANGEVASEFSGELIVTTTRGRLSERGGRVKASNGVARVSLSSVPETVGQVVVGARDPAGLAVPGTAMLEFL